MIQFFRKIRKGLLTEGKLLRYLTYAIGEILLVFIGILAAIQVNNWNEEKKNKEKTEDILRQIQRDLRDNIYETARGSNYYFYKDSLTTLILNNEIDYFNFQDINLGTARRVIMNVSPVTLIDNGFQNWTAQEQIPEEYQVMNEVLNTLFVDWKYRMDFAEDRMTTMVNDNIQDLADTQTWFYARIKGDLPENLAEKEASYFQYDTLYKNKVAIYQISAISDYLPLIDAYRDLSVEAYKKIDNLLGAADGENHEEFFLPSVSFLEKLAGTYQDPNNPTLRPTISVKEHKLVYVLGDFEASIMPISELTFFMGQVGSPAKISFKMRGDSVYAMTEGQYGTYTELRKVE